MVLNRTFFPGTRFEFTIGNPFPRPVPPVPPPASDEEKIVAAISVAVAVFVSLKAFKVI